MPRYTKLSLYVFIVIFSRWTLKFIFQWRYKRPGKSYFECNRNEVSDKWAMTKFFVRLRGRVPFYLLLRVLDNVWFSVRRVLRVDVGMGKRLVCVYASLTAWE